MNGKLLIALMILLIGMASAYKEEWAKHTVSRDYKCFLFIISYRNNFICILFCTFLQKKYKVSFKDKKEQQRREKFFKDTHEMIEAHNKKKGMRSRLEHNKFSHMVKTTMMIRPNQSSFLPYSIWQTNRVIYIFNYSID